MTHPINCAIYEEIKLSGNPDYPPIMLADPCVSPTAPLLGSSGEPEHPLFGFVGEASVRRAQTLTQGSRHVLTEWGNTPTTLGATARSYRRQDGADAAARFEKFLPGCASLRPPISLKFTTEKHGGMVHLAPNRQTRICSRFCTMIPERFAARRR